MKPNKKTVNLAKKYGYDNIEYLFSHGGISYYAPIQEEVSYVGMPEYVIEYTFKGRTYSDVITDTDFAITDAIEDIEKRGKLMIVNPTYGLLQPL